jgi:hypothetical protein
VVDYVSSENIASRCGRLRDLLEEAPVLDDLAVVVEAEDVDGGNVPGA